MGNSRLIFSLRAVAFALGLALIIAAISYAMIEAAHDVVNVFSASVTSGIFGGIGGFLVFIGWKAEQTGSSHE